ncbi:MAG: lytic transglycosylase domain-containing protein [Bdellovibrionales bacterium]|nr:lytic transglycosylase domain-containing protein [Bdellovibrionales bacterium]
MRMRKGASERSFLLLSFVLISAFAHAATPLDLVPEGTPILTDTEFFPLMGRPHDAPAPLRSEARSPEEEKKWRAIKAKVLADFGSRINPEFAIPEGLKERTSFWFDIYTRYGDAHHIVHHQRYPWIVYRVFDGTSTILNGKGPLWLRRERASKMAKMQLAEIRTALQRLAKRKTYDQLPTLERELFEKLSVLPGPRKAVLRLAATEVRSQLGQKDFFERGLVNSSRYLPYMEEEFKRHGLPTEITRLPFVESSFNEMAYSKVGASGIWQIMPTTGKSYMIVSEQIDERNSPLKATNAAARLLRSYFRAVDSWPLALTSYNNGIGNTQKAMKGAGSRELPTIIERYHRGAFRFASSNFYTCFLAALYAEKYSELLFKELPREPLQERETLKLSGRTNARLLTRVVGLSQNEMLKYNLDLRGVLKRNGMLPRGYEIHLPPGLKDKLIRRIGIQEKSTRPRT